MKADKMQVTMYVPLCLQFLCTCRRVKGGQAQKHWSAGCRTGGYVCAADSMSALLTNPTRAG